MLEIDPINDDYKNEKKEKIKLKLLLICSRSFALARSIFALVINRSDPHRSFCINAIY